jgi:hypothetical protein
MNFDLGNPGSPDGPPAPERKDAAERFGFAFAILLGTGLGLLLVSGIAWALAWIWTNFPA